MAGDVKRRLLELLGDATAAGWTFQRACRVLGLGERRARDWQRRAEAGVLDDRAPGATAVHALRPAEVDAILELADEWGDVDASHRKLAHRGSYLGRVWVSPATVLRVLVKHGRQLPVRAPREREAALPWPECVDYRPRQVWGYDLSAFTRARTDALAILDLVSRKWIDTMLCPEATSLQVQALFTRALDGEGLRDDILTQAGRLADPAYPGDAQPVLLAVSDNGPQMTSGSTREFMALHAIATHYQSGLNVPPRSAARNLKMTFIVLRRCQCLVRSAAPP